MQRVFAISLLTLKEAYRKKVFLVLLVFAVALVSSSAFFPVMDGASRISLVKIWSIRAITLFSALISIFLASVSIPSDVEEKRIYTLVSKPVSKTDIFVGKFMGFAAVVAIFIFITGAITIVYLRIVKATLAENVILDSKLQILATALHHTNAYVKEDEDKHQLSGNMNSSITWAFEGLDRASLPQNPQFEINMNAEDVRNKIAYTAYIEAKVINPDTKEEKEFRDINIRSNTPYLLDFPKELISKSGKVNIEISRKEMESVIWATREGVVIYERHKPFEFNYLRGLGLIYIQTLIVLAASIMASAFLGGPVAIFFGIAVFFCGSIYNFVQTSLKIAEGMIATQKEHPRAYTRPEDMPLPVVEVAAHITKFALKFIPDFKKFDFLTPLLDNKWVMSKFIGEAIFYGSIFILVFVGLGMLIMKFRDFS